MDSRSFLIWLLAALPCSALSLEEAVQRALEASPEVRRAQAEVDAALSALGASGRLVRDNPTLQAGAGRRSSMGGGQLDVDLSLTQPIEIAGQRGARVAQAEAGLAQARARLEAVRSETAADAGRAYVELLAAKALAGVAQRGVELAARLSSAAKERAAAGDASQLEVHAQQFELGRARRQLALARSEVAAASTRLRLLLAAEGELAPSGSLAALGSSMAPPPGSADDAVAWALANRADLRASASALGGAQAARRLTVREAYPSPRLGVAYEREGDEQVIGGAVAFELPFFDRNQTARGEADAKLAQASIAHEALQRLAKGEVRLAHEQHASARAAVEEYRADQNLAADESEALVEEALRAGKLSLAEGLLLQRNALEARAGYVEALRDLALARIELARAMGAP